MAVGALDRRYAVCREHLNAWTKEGGRWAACGTRVTGIREVGCLPDHKGFGHADCGGRQLKN